jgi:hypothetical protein
MGQEPAASLPSVDALPKHELLQIAHVPNTRGTSSIFTSHIHCGVKYIRGAPAKTGHCMHEAPCHWSLPAHAHACLPSTVPGGTWVAVVLLLASNGIAVIGALESLALIMRVRFRV